MAQGAAYRSVFRNAAYIFFIKLFPAFSAIAVLILYSRQLPQDVYGNYQEVWVKLILLGTLAYAGLPVTIITYPAEVIKSFARQIKAKNYIIYTAWFALWAVIFAWLGRLGLNLSASLCTGLILLYVVHAVQESLLVATQKMNGLLILNLLYAVYFLIVHLQALNDFDLAQLLWYLLMGMIVRAALLCVLIFLVYKNVNDTVVSDDLGKARNLWLHLGFYDLMQNIFRFIDKFILSIFLSAGLYAIYFNGSQTAEVPFLPYLFGAVSSSVLIELSNKNSDPSQSYKLLHKSGKMMACVIFPLFFFLWFFSGEIFSVVLTEKYSSSVPIFLAAILVLPLRTYNYTTMLQHLHQGALINKGALLDLFLALTLMYPFYLLFGLPGIALSLVVSTYVQVGYYLHRTSRLINVPVKQLLPLQNWVIKFLSFGVLLFASHFLLATFVDAKIVVVAGAVIAFVMGLVAFRLELRKK